MNKVCNFCGTVNDAHHSAACVDQQKNQNGIDWNLVENAPSVGGWYIGALNPRNYKDLDAEFINNWRESFGFCLVWFNPDCADRWFEPDAHGFGCDPVGDRITHWAKRPGVPKV